MRTRRDDNKRAGDLPLAVTALVALAACSSAQTSTGTPALAPETDCPATHHMTLDTCVGAPPVGYGHLPSRPLEWGATSAGALYFGRLVCPGGGLAISERVREPGESLPPGVSAWEVHCPGDEAPRKWYVSARKCGSPCPPDGLHVIPQAALQRYLASVEAFEGGQPAPALDLAQAAVTLAPPNELLTLWLGTMLEQNGRASEAVAYYEAAIRMNPDDPEHKLFLARAQRAAGHEAPYRAAVTDLLAKLPGGHPLVPELQCLQSEILRHDGKTAEASTLAQRACAAGKADCCPAK